MNKIIRLMIFLFLVGGVILIKYVGVGMVGEKMVVGKRTIHVPVVGPSMYPTFAWCSDVGGLEDCAVAANQNSRRIIPEFFAVEDKFVPELEMIVSINHESRGIVKRIVGLPGDVLKLNGGYLYRNGKRVDEPYLWKEGRTYGNINGFLKDCVDVIVPKDSMFVLGDNRLLSGDSREFGFLKLTDVDAYLPIVYQENLGLPNYPLSSILANQNDSSAIATINEIRKNHGLNTVTNEPGLNEVAQFLGDVLASSDYDYEIAQANGGMKKVGNKANSLGYGYGYLNTSFFPGVFDSNDYQYLFMEKGIKEIIEKPNIKKIGIVGHDTKDVSGCESSITTIVSLE